MNTLWHTILGAVWRSLGRLAGWRWRIGARAATRRRARLNIPWDQDIEDKDGLDTIRTMVRETQLQHHRMTFRPTQHTPMGGDRP